MPKDSKKSALLLQSVRKGALAAAAQTAEGGNATLNASQSAEHVAGGAVRLEKRTHLDTAHTRVVLRDYGGGLAEIGWSFISSLSANKAGRGLSERREENKERAVRRAQAQLRRRVLAAGADHLLTLTYRENVISFDQAASDLSKFVRRVKKMVPKWTYIAVAERQKRGAWHWHLAVVGRQDVDLLRRTWRKVVGDGNIDVNPPKGEGKSRQIVLARYLSKYLAKGFAKEGVALNARRYRASQGIKIPGICIQVPNEERSNASGVALAHLKAITGEIGFVWFSEDNLAGWACSWK